MHIIICINIYPYAMQIAHTYLVDEKKARLVAEYERNVQSGSLNKNDLNGTDEQIVPSVRYIFAGRKASNVTDLSYLVGLQVAFRSR